ncbi:TasA family protein [Patescibacteria group bacterium]
MKKIIISLAMIVAVGAVVVGATRAYFSDTETSTGNMITSGALDLTLNGKNGEVVTAVVNIEDMKPSQTWYSGPITLEVFNNPGKLYKHVVAPFECTGGERTEPECEAESGQWDGATCTGGTPVDDLPRVTWFDLEVWNDKNQNEEIEEDEWEIIIPDGMITVEDIASHWIYLGEYGEQLQMNKIVIRQSFHMDGEAGNEFQGDSCTFTEEFKVLQTNAPHPENTLATLKLDNKDPQTWDPINDSKVGYLTYNTAGATFDYTFTGQGLVAGTEYSLIYYADGYPGNNPGALIGTMITDGSGNVNASGSTELGMNLPHSSDANYPDGAKIWLVPSTGYAESTNSVTPWAPADYLYEMNLIQYEDQ